jgi:hypothetical protein
VFSLDRARPTCQFLNFLHEVSMNRRSTQMHPWTISGVDDSAEVDLRVVLVAAGRGKRTTR